MKKELKRFWLDRMSIDNSGFDKRANNTLEH